MIKPLRPSFIHFTSEPIKLLNSKQHFEDIFIDRFKPVFFATFHIMYAIHLNQTN